MNQVERVKTPLFATDQLQDMGFDIVIFPCSTVFTAAKAMKLMLNVLIKKHTSSDYLDNMATFEEYNDMVGMKELVEMERRYEVDEFKKKIGS